MIPIEQARRIVGTLGVTVSDGEVQKIAARILQDNFCSGRILESLLAERASEVLQGIHPLEKEALIQRLRIAGTRTALVPHGKARWTASFSPTPGKPKIVAACSACNQSLTFIPNPAAGNLGRDFVFSHCAQNEICPDEILHEYYKLCTAPKIHPEKDYSYEALQAERQAAADKLAREDANSARIYVAQQGGKL